jgi:biotin-(acetyl-CoA carboxylase) ligase
MELADPDFPPLLTGHPVAPRRIPFAEACRRVRTHELGAAEIVWSRSSTRAACAIVLEPEVCLGRALQMAALTMVALGDCLGSLCPPQVAVAYRWPGDMLLNGTPVGQVQIAAPRVERAQVPSWLVVGAEVTVATPKGQRAGRHQDWSQTSLAEVAGPSVSRSDVLRSLAAHFLSAVHTWQERGFAVLRAQWMLRAAGREHPVSIAARGSTLEGRVIGLEENGDLLLQDAGGTLHTLAFAEHVAWHEPWGGT